MFQARFWTLFNEILKATCLANGKRSPVEKMLSRDGRNPPIARSLSKWMEWKCLNRRHEDCRGGKWGLGAGS